MGRLCCPLRLVGGRKLLAACFGAVLLSAWGIQLLAQSEDSRGTDPVVIPTDGVIRVNVDVVLVDAIVTDKEGRHVRDLTAEDFEIYQNGHPQRITNFSYIVAQDESAYERQEAKRRERDQGTDQPQPPVVFTRPKPEEVRRSIAVIVDDIGMSFESIAFVRQSLAEFIDEQIQDSDLMAVAMTGARMGALQQFTMDRRQLHAAVNRLRWNPMQRTSPLDSSFFARRFAPGRRGEAAHERNLALAMLNTMRFIVGGMRELPGRKSAILISEGFRLWYAELEGMGSSAYVMTEAARRLAETAHRSGVVIYAVDPRGLEPPGLTARDDLSTMIGSLSPTDLANASIENIVQATIAERRVQYEAGKQGLSFLPASTGGLFLHMGNDINQHLGKVLDDQQGYYLIGYAADPETIRSGNQRRFPRISLKVNRPGLEAHYRSSFMGSLEDEEDETPLTPLDEMIRALTSPFGTNQIDLTLTSLHEYDPKEGSSIRSWLHIAPGQLSFDRSEGDEQNAIVELVAATFGEKEKPVDELSQTMTVHAKGETLKRIKQHGLVCKLTVPIKKPGPYQMCVVIRDKNTYRLGAASQFVEVPDVRKGGLALSGIVVLGTDSENSGLQDGLAVPASMSVRKFQRGMRLNYALYIYNASLEKKTREPKLETQVRLYRDGQEVYAGDLKVFDSVRLSKRQVLMADGYLELGEEIEPGNYILQYTVKDELADEDRNVSSQWIDFEVVG